MAGEWKRKSESGCGSVFEVDVDVDVEVDVAVEAKVNSIYLTFDLYSIVGFTYLGGGQMGCCFCIL